MPIYEYRCNQCNRRFSHLHGVVANAPALECPRCHGTDLKRLISRVSRVRSEDERLDALDPSGFGDLEDPANMRRWAKAMGDEMGEDLEEDFEEALEEMIEEEEKGEETSSEDAGGEETPAATETNDR
ncbi:MAG: zinc ribbon domain-containing protein [Armatimonadota bacterium]|nr:zinc ribbon domain-containing protein [Armatimonadota bacterium]